MRVPGLFSILLHIFLAGFDKNSQSDDVKTKTANQAYRAFSKVRAHITAIDRVLSLGIISSETQAGLRDARKALCVVLETHREAYLAARK